MKPVLWMVQTNLGNPTTYKAIRAASGRNGFLFEGVPIIPFSDELPEVAHDGPVVAYGSTRFINNVVRSGRWRPGAFFDAGVFTVANCLRTWGSRMVNSDGTIVRLDAVASLPYAETDEVFVRPNGDLKEFSGEVMTFKALCDWSALVQKGDFAFVDGSLLIAIARPKPIKAEWRVFAVEGPRIIAATRYRLAGRVAPLAEVPSEVISFVESRLREWMPAPAMALDVAEVNGELRVLELSDLHSAGHYAADVEAIVVETSRVAARHWANPG